MARRTLCGGPVWFQPPGGGFGPGCERDFGGYFKTPVCAAEGEPPYDGPQPLFEEDFRSGPVGLEFPTTAAWFTTLGVVAPNHLYNVEETTPGDNLVDQIGSRTLTAVSSGASFPLSGRTALGLPAYGQIRNWRSKKCAEFQRDEQYYFIAPNTTWFDLNPGGTPTSLAAMVIVRSVKGIIQESAVIPRSMMSKAIAAGGWGLMSHQSGPITNWTRNGGGVSSHVPAAWLGNMARQWHCLLFGWDQTATQHWELSNWGSNSGALTMGWPVEAAGAAFRIGYCRDWINSFTTAPFQIAYAAFWEGADAETIRGQATTLHDGFWKNRMDDPGTRYGGNLGGYATVDVMLGQHHCGIIEDPAGGDVSLCNFDQGVQGYDICDDFSHAGKLGGRMGGNNIVECWNNTDVWDSVWTRVNMSYSTANADYDTSPIGFLDAWKLTATANNAQIYQAATCGPTTCVMGFFYKRHSSMGSNVTGRFRLYNTITTNYEFDVAFTATDKWQHLEQVVTPANSACRIIVEIDNSGDSLCLYRVYGAQGRRFMSHMNVNGFITSFPTSLYGTMPATEDWCKAMQGEAEIVYAEHRTALNVNNEGLVDVKASDNDDRRFVGFHLVASNRPIARVWNANGGSNRDTNGPVGPAWYQTEHTLIFQWDYSGAPRWSGSYERMFYDGVEYLGGVGAWTVDGTRLDRIYISRGAGNANVDFHGVIARVRIWENPWRYL